MAGRNGWTFPVPVGGIATTGVLVGVGAADWRGLIVIGGAVVVILVSDKASANFERASAVLLGRKLDAHVPRRSRRSASVRQTEGRDPQRQALEVALLRGLLRMSRHRGSRAQRALRAQQAQRAMRARRQRSPIHQRNQANGGEARLPSTPTRRRPTGTAGPGQPV